MKKSKKFATDAVFFDASHGMITVPAVYIPVTDTTLNPTEYNPAINCIQLPDIDKHSTPEKICFMITPLLRGSTFYIRAPNNKLNPPAVCQLQIGAGSTYNLKLSQALDGHAMRVLVEEKGNYKAQVGQEQQGFSVKS